MDDSAERTDWSEFPSVGIACEQVPASYELSQMRLGMIESRMGALVATAATVALAVPALVRGMGDAAISFSDWRFVAGVLAGALAACLGTWFRNRTRLVFIDPAGLRAEVAREPASFQHYLLYWAGEHFAENDRAITALARTGDRLAILCGCEVAFFMWWLWAG
ncbi:hypothetical protein [Candidatus Palauibacter sp.]|uniref:hypothetical protein n=1 Tax=Candidatus Palauibacter sp. TaxID=3101350 RepID=UPI003CC59212